MYCRNCGSEIPNEAKFCTFCGTETVKPKAQVDEGVNSSEGQKPEEAQNTLIADEESDVLSAANSPASNASEAPLAVGNTAGEELSGSMQVANSTPSEQGATVAVENASAQAAAAQPETSNLKAAVAQNKRRSRRRMPMILLVALALALATSVAYAAYRVYTDVWVPYQAEQQQATQNGQKNAQNEKAHDAYNGIIEEYAQALTDAKNGTLEKYPMEGVFEKYPDVNSEPLASSGSEDYVYALKDLNNDGVDELLIGKDFSKYGAYRGSVAIYDMWTYQDDKVIKIAQGITRGDYYLRENNVIMSRGNGGAQVNAYTMMTLNQGKLYDVNDLDENDVSKSVDNWTKGESLEQDWPDDTSTSGVMTKFAKYDASGNKTDSGTCTLDEFSTMLDDLNNKYPENTSVEWTTISAN